MPTPIESALRGLPPERLCRALAIQPETLCRIQLGHYQEPEIMTEIERRLRAAGLLRQTRHDA